MNITLGNAVIFGISVLFQVGALLLMPLTKGFTAPLPSLGLALLFSTGLALLARLSAAGAELGVLVPLASAVVPITTTLIAIPLFGESASPIKLGCLLAACALIGLASR